METETEKQTPPLRQTEINNEEKQRWENREHVEMKRKCMDTETGRN